MTLARRIVAYGMLLLGLTLGIGPATAWASSRPNAIDRRVDALSPRVLMESPATSLVDPARQAAAIRRVHWTLPGWVAEQLFEAVALAYFWLSGSASALRDRLRRRTRSVWVVRFAFGASLALIARTAAFLPAFYLYRVERVMQLSDELTRAWGVFWILHTLLAMAIAGLIAAGVLWLVERTHQWYLYTIAAILAVSLGWSFASPYFQIPGSTDVRPVSGALGARLHVLLKKAGVANLPVLVERTHGSPVGKAAILGLGDSKRIVLTDTLVAGDTPAEVSYAVAYEIGQIVRGDATAIALIEGGIIIVFAALAVVVADRVGFRRDDDPLTRLALVGALLAIVYLAAVPVRNAELRSYAFGGDRYAVALTGDPSAAVRSLVRQTDQRMDEVCPGLLATMFLDTHPGAGARVAAINGVPSACP